MKTIDELDALHAAATAGEWVVRSYQEPSGEFNPAPSWEVYDEDNLVLTAALKNNWPAFSARLRAAEAEVERLRGLVRWFLDGDDHTHEDDCGARGQHDIDVCRNTKPCGDDTCEGPHCTCDATEMRDRARAALGEP